MIAKFRQLAEDIECEQLFLRFINLLINDAIFLRDEGLNYMKQIQEKEAARVSWSSHPRPRGRRLSESSTTTWRYSLSAC